MKHYLIDFDIDSTFISFLLFIDYLDKKYKGKVKNTVM